MALFPLDVELTVTNTRNRIALRLVIQRSLSQTVARFATRLAEVVKVIHTPVTFIAGNSFFTRTFSFVVALKTTGTCGK